MKAFIILFLSILLTECSSIGLEYVVTQTPSITANTIDGVLCSNNSPSCGTGASLYLLGKQYGIDPAFALAFFRQESTYGLYGMAKVTLSLGNIQCVDGYECYKGFSKYTSWQQGYEAWYKLISGDMYVKSGKTTVDAIVGQYESGSSSSDIQAYVSSVESSVDKYRSMSNGS